MLADCGRVASPGLHHILQGLVARADGPLIGPPVAHMGAEPQRGKRNQRGENKMAKKAIKRLKKSTKVEAAKTLRKLGVG